MLYGKNHHQKIYILLKILSDQTVGYRNLSIQYSIPNPNFIHDLGKIVTCESVTLAS